MRVLCAALIVAVSVCVLSTGLQAQEKEVTLKGTLMCAKCVLKETKDCVTAIKVKENAKEVTYYLKDKGRKESYHEEVCGGDRVPGSVTGEIREMQGKKWVINVKKVTYDKK